MKRSPDADGRYPLSTREYEALRTIFGAVNALDTDTLRERCRLVKNGWRDLRLAESLLRRVMEDLLWTVPVKKLNAIRTELQNTINIVKIRPVGGYKTDGCVYVDQGAMVRLAERAIAMDCVFCEKRLEEGKRCPLYRDLNACFPYDLDEEGDVLCPFAGQTALRMEDTK